jgi:hypothetical protein
MISKNQVFYWDFADRVLKKLAIALKVFSPDSASKTDSRTLVFDRPVHVFSIKKIGFCQHTD